MRPDIFPRMYKNTNATQAAFYSLLFRIPNYQPPPPPPSCCCSELKRTNREGLKPVTPKKTSGGTSNVAVEERGGEGAGAGGREFLFFVDFRKEGSTERGELWFGNPCVREGERELKSYMYCLYVL